MKTHAEEAHDDINANQSGQNNETKGTVKNILRKWYFWAIVTTLLVLVVFLAIFIPRMIEEKRLQKEESRISAEIETCVSSIGIDSLDFRASCYEDRGRVVPDSIIEADKRKTDMILAQAAYDDCRAYAQLRKDALWDLNDTSPDNLVMDAIDSRHLDFINTEYQNSLRACDEKYALQDPYNENWDTFVYYRLSGWIYDYKNIQVFDLENSQGKISEATSIRADEKTSAIPKGVGSVAYIVAYKFKQEHNNWWY